MTSAGAVLLDVPLLIYSVVDPLKLTPRARAVLSDEQLERYVSVASLWEVGIKSGLGKLDLGESYEAFVRRWTRHSNVRVMPITVSVVRQVNELPPIHRDPFDRILVCQSRVLRSAIASPDAMFDDYGVDRIW